MGNTFHNIPTLEAYEQCDFVEIGKEIFDKIQRNAFPIQNYKVYKFQKKVDIYNEKTRLFEQVLSCYYCIFGIFYQNYDLSWTWTRIPKYHHWKLERIKDENYYTWISGNTFSLIIYDTADLTEYINFCNRYNECIDNYTQMAIDTSLNIYKESIRDESIMKATFNFLKMLPENVFTDFTSHILFLYLITFHNMITNKYIDIPKEIDEQASSILRQHKDIANNYDFIYSSFAQFNDLISERFDISPSYCLLVVYLLLINQAAGYYTNRWEKEYDQNAECNNISEYVEHCVRNEILTEQDMYGVMLLSWSYIHSSADLEISIFEAYSTITNSIAQARKKTKSEAFAQKIFNDNETTRNSNDNVEITIDDIDLMTGVEFEQFLANMFAKKKFDVKTTKKSGDQGIDIIIEKNGTRTGIQAKCYGNNVGNSAIQEAVAGKRYYNLDKVMVITNNYFTTGAIELAKANNVILWDRNILKEKI